MESRSPTDMIGRGLKQNLLSGTRLALFLPVRALDFRVSVGQYVALVATSLAFWLAGGIARQGFSGSFDFSALTAALAEIPLVLGTCLVAARLFRDTQLALAFAVLLVSTDPIFEVVGLAIQLAAASGAIGAHLNAANWAFVAWAFAAIVRTQFVLTGWRGRASVFSLGLFAGLLLFLLAFFPRGELWVPAQEDTEADAAGTSIVEEEIFHRQGMLLDAQLAALRPQRRGVDDLYFVGVAADAGQDTFYKELASVKELLNERFDTSGRSIALVNNPATLKDLPIASVSNLRSTLVHLGNTIDADNDIVLLHITTHGSRDYRLAFDLQPLELAQLTPIALARMFADSGIKWKVIVISACFSGGFIEPLKDPDTLIITAADAFHSSFGCDYDSDYTWFSRALYDDALRETFSFTKAFEQAKRSVGERERAGGYEPSNPQIFVGEAIRKKLSSLERRLAGRSARDPQRIRASSVRASDSRMVLVNGR
jgi:Peptidase C13 family